MNLLAKLKMFVLHRSRREKQGQIQSLPEATTRQPKGRIKLIQKQRQNQHR